ncbi:MAG: hypothetical protein ACLQFI_03690 [Methylocella sp.]
MEIDRRQLLTALASIVAAVAAPAFPASAAPPLTARELHYLEDFETLSHALNGLLATGDVVQWVEDSGLFRLLAVTDLDELQKAIDRTPLEARLCEGFRALMRLSPY